MRLRAFRIVRGFLEGFQRNCVDFPLQPTKSASRTRRSVNASASADQSAILVFCRRLHCATFRFELLFRFHCFRRQISSKLLNRPRFPLIQSPKRPKKGPRGSEAPKRAIIGKQSSQSRWMRTKTLTSLINEANLRKLFSSSTFPGSGTQTRQKDEKFLELQSNSNYGRGLRQSRNPFEVQGRKV